LPPKRHAAADPTTKATQNTTNIRIIHSTPSRIIQPVSLSYSSRVHRDLHSFPTRRSSDLERDMPADDAVPTHETLLGVEQVHRADRKSTRLNSSHEWISYAVFCLKKKIRQPRGRLTPAGREPANHGQHESQHSTLTN